MRTDLLSFLHVASSSFLVIGRRRWRLLRAASFCCRARQFTNDTRPAACAICAGRWRVRYHFYNNDPRKPEIVSNSDKSGVSSRHSRFSGGRIGGIGAILALHYVRPSWRLLVRQQLGCHYVLCSPMSLCQELVDAIVCS